MATITHGTVPSTFSAFDYDTCLLGLFNGTLPDGRHGNGSYTKYGVYAPTSTEKTACLNAHDSYSGSVKYAKWTIIFIMVSIGILAVQNLIDRLDRQRRLNGKPRPFLLLPFLRASARSWTYARGRIFGSSTPTLGVSLMLLSFFAFANIITWGNRPYYRPHNFGSPPLGLRSEWVATAMIPFMYALATKRNFIHTLTGLPYQTLMVVHQWSAQICLFFSFVHTIAMIIRVTPIEPWSYTMVHRTTYWTGFAALSQLFALCFLSFGPIRRVMYETFYWLHMLTAFGFLAFMFPHCLDGWVLPTSGPLSMLNSWAYLWASVAVWFAAIVWRFGMILYQTRFFTDVSRASLTILPGDVIQITVSSNITYEAGQHFFLRFPTIEPFGSHPFTVASSPIESFGTEQKINFVLRPARGVTSRLFSMATKSAIERLPVVLDGPYGGENVASLSACDTVVLFAGGVGITAVVPVATALAKRMNEVFGDREKRLSTLESKKSIVIVWAARQKESFEWFKEDLTDIQLSNSIVSVQLHATSVPSALPTGTQGNYSESDSMEKATVKSYFGRPDVVNIIQDLGRLRIGRMGVLVCGPESLCDDVRKAVVLQQTLILDRVSSIEECELHEETFAY